MLNQVEYINTSDNKKRPKKLLGLRVYYAAKASSLLLALVA